MPSSQVSGALPDLHHIIHVNYSIYYVLWNCQWRIFASIIKCAGNVNANSRYAKKRWTHSAKFERNSIKTTNIHEHNGDDSEMSHELNSNCEQSDACRGVLACASAYTEPFHFFFSRRTCFSPFSSLINQLAWKWTAQIWKKELIIRAFTHPCPVNVLHA